MNDEGRAAVAGGLLIFGPIIMMTGVPSQGLHVFSRVMSGVGALMVGVGGAIVVRLLRDHGRELVRLRDLLQDRPK